MNAKTLATFVATVMATIAITLAIFLPAEVWAGKPAKAALAVKEPVLTVNGCEIRLRPTAKKFKAGDTPTLVLEAINTTDEPIKFEAIVSMTSTSPASRRSRMLVMPAQLWKYTCPISLAAGEVKQIQLPTGTKAPGGAMLSFYVTVGKKTGAFGSCPVSNPLAQAAAGMNNTIEVLKVTPAAQGK